MAIFEKVLAFLQSIVSYFTSKQSTAQEKVDEKAQDSQTLRDTVKTKDAMTSAQTDEVGTSDEFLKRIDEHSA